MELNKKSVLSYAIIGVAREGAKGQFLEQYNYFKDKCDSPLQLINFCSFDSSIFFTFKSANLETFSLLCNKQFY